MNSACSESSKQLNVQRLKVLDAKQKMIKEVFAQAKTELKGLAKGPGYADLMAELLCQVRILKRHRACMSPSASRLLMERGN